MSLHLYTGNRLEKLVEAMAEQLSMRSTDGPAPLQPEIIVTGGLGMSTWLQQQLTAYMPIVANLKFPYINAVLEFVLLHADGRSHRWRELENAAADPFSRELLRWRIFDLLKAIEPTSAGEVFGPLRHYFAALDELGELKRYQLAERLADLYDRYQLYRPSWLSAWDRRCPGMRLPGGPPPELTAEEQWQPALWQRIRDEAGAAQPRHERLASFSVEPSSLRESGIHRLFLFGIGALPPPQLQFIEALSRVVPIHLFVLSPCSTYWFDDRTARHAERELQDLREMGVADPSPFVETGNPLLTSLGVVGQEFLRQINAESGGTGHVNLDDDTWMTAPAGAGLLHAIQRDIFYRRAAALPAESAETPSFEEDWGRIDGDDDSIIINSCHSEQRELEVLRDWLLRFFDAAHENAKNADGQAIKTSRLQPRQVLVMAPDISRYLPYIEAVFGREARHADSYIPYSIADRTAAEESLVVNAFLQLLQLPHARFDAPAVMDLLAVAPVARAFGIDSGALEKLRTWVHESGIRWGLSTDHRETVLAPPDNAGAGERQLPDGHIGTWAFGLDRMLLGYALDDDGGDLFADTIAPFGEVEGGAASYVGQLSHLIDRLAALRNSLSGDFTARAWSTKLTTVLDNFFVGDNESYLEIYLIRHALESLSATAAAVDATSTFGIRVARQYVRAALEGEFVGGGFCRGKVTFCSMLPMRSIPADVVCLLGMSDGEYPRQDRPAGFDLTAGPGRRRQGDRSRRLDDRYMFLEALLAARENLYISYVGSDIRENVRLPASVLVSELQDYARDQLTAVGAASVAARVPPVIEQRLQAFNSAYFDDPAPQSELPSADTPFSYSKSACTAARVLQQARRTTPRQHALFTQSSGGGPVELLPELDSDSPLRTVSIEQFIRFFNNPVEYLLRNRLSVYLNDDTSRLQDSESFAPTGLEKYGIKQKILDEQLAAPPSTMAAVQKRLMAQGELPLGTAGRIWFEQEWKATDDFLNLDVPDCGLKVRDTMASPPTEQRRVEYPLPDGSCTLNGVLDLHDDVHFCGRFGTLRPKDRLSAWTRHLLLCASGACIRTIFVGWTSEKKRSLLVLPPLPTETAQTHLENLMALYNRGLRQPLMLVPCASWAYVQGKEDKERLGKANEAWLGSFNRDAYDGVLNAAFRFCWGGGPLTPWVTDPFDGDSDIDGDSVIDSDSALAIDIDDVNLSSFDEIAWLVFGPLKNI